MEPIAEEAGRQLLKVYCDDATLWLFMVFMALLALVVIQLMKGIFYIQEKTYAQRLANEVIDRIEQRAKEHAETMERIMTRDAMNKRNKGGGL